MIAKCVRAESGLEVGKEYEIEYSIIGGFHTEVYIVGSDWPVNSMAFDENFQKALHRAIDYFNDHLSVEAIRKTNDVSSNLKVAINDIYSKYIKSKNGKIK